MYFEEGIMPTGNGCLPYGKKSIEITLKCHSPNIGSEMAWSLPRKAGYHPMAMKSTVEMRLLLLCTVNRWCAKPTKVNSNSIQIPGQWCPLQSWFKFHPKNIFVFDSIPIPIPPSLKILEIWFQLRFRNKNCTLLVTDCNLQNISWVLLRVYSTLNT